MQSSTLKTVRLLPAQGSRVFRLCWCVVTGPDVAGSPEAPWVPAARQGLLETADAFVSDQALENPVDILYMQPVDFREKII